jgi:hypothetical protein
MKERNPENTLRSYLDLLNQSVLKIKKPFSKMYEDFALLLSEWQSMYEESTIHLRRCTLKVFLGETFKCCHNHPLGDPTSFDDDINETKKALYSVIVISRL